ncbi:hypothetical protein Asi02nite_69520 [Asanoa siamensis]|uniref:Uncharacterized protein n=1 Tax=Asanoa siamensis TaxID=926357 RepID=A0ABQ4D1L8_9ACTN|nr:hypothetical protein Asi02nite_69520 [Asanoa siamensis]
MTQQHPASEAERSVARLLEAYQRAGHLAFLPPPVEEVRAHANRRRVGRIALATAAAVAGLAAGGLAIVGASGDSPRPVAPAPSSPAPTHPTPVPAETSAVPTSVTVQP